MYINNSITEIVTNLPKFSDDYIDILIDYLVGNGRLFQQQTPGYQKLLLKYLQDKNAKTICEEISLRLMNVDSLEIKQGADGYDVVKNVYIEVKPMYADKLKGGNPFNDLTEDGVAKKQSWDMCVSGFSDGKLVFLVRFPFSYMVPWALSRIQEVAEKNRKKTKKHTRCSPNFGYKQWIDCPDLDIQYLHKDAIKYMSKPMYKALIKRIQQND